MTIAHVVETSVNVSNKKNNRVLNWTILERKIGIWREDNTDNIIASLKMMVRRIKGFFILTRMYDLYNCTKFRKCAENSAENFMLILGLYKGEVEKSWPILQEIFYDNIKLTVKETAQNIRL